MRLSTLDPTTFSDETLIPLEISGCAPAHPETGAVTFEQSMHLNGRHPDSPVRPGWLGLLLDLDPQSDLEQVSAAAIRVLNRHHELRVCYRPSEQGWQRWVLDEVQVGVGEPTQLGSTQPERVARLQELIDEQANAWTPAGIHLSVLEPSHRLLLGADHTHVDAISMAVIARDLLAALGQLDEELDEIESFGSATDRHALRDGKVDPASIARWHSFFDLAGGLPSLPVDLGLAPGETAPRAMIVEHLLDPQEMAAWSTQAKERGSGLAALALAAITLAIDEVSTEARRPLPVVLPMHTRDQPQAMRSVGWYVRNAPLVVPQRRPDEGLLDLAERIAQILPQALSDGWTPLSHVLSSYPAELTGKTLDVFMVSVVDYRKLPAHEHLLAHRATQLSAGGQADGLQVWFARTNEGLAIRLRFPDTADARAVIEGILARVRYSLAQSPA